jgi:hypothetical protein
MNRLIARLTPLVLCLAPLAGVPAQTPPAAAASLPEPTAEQWRADLDFMAAEMERRHRHLYHSVSREDFAAAVADLRGRIPTLARHQIIVGLMRLAAMVGDGHTNVSPYRDPAIGFRALPVRFYLFEDGLFVTAAAPEHAALAGARVVAVGGVPAEQAIARVRAIVGRDNEIGANVFVPVYLAMPEILHALGLSAGPDAAELVLDRDGRRRTVTLPAAGRFEAWPPDIDVALDAPAGWTSAAGSTPLWLRDPRATQLVEELPGALYVRLTKVENGRDRSLAALGAFVEERARTLNPRAILLDLRLNRGGSGDLLPPLVRHLVRSEDQDTRLFVLTGRSTFSAAQFLVDDLDRYSEAILVGEPTGSKPNHYGDSLRITLPNSRVTVRVSIYWWQENQDLARPWTAPEVAAPLAFADWRDGRDPALAAALAWRPEAPLHARLVAALDEGGIARVAAVYDAYAGEIAHRYADLDRELKLAAIDRLRAGRAAGAAALMRFAADRFPDDPVVHYLLASAGIAAGDRELAARAVARTLELDPNHREARALAERLQAPAP